MSVTEYPPTDTDQDLLSTDSLATLAKCKQLYQTARKAKANLLSRWRRNFLLLNNQMWSDFRMAWMPSPSDSEIMPIMANLIGWMTDQSVAYTVNAATQPNTPWYEYLSQLADDLEAILESNWKVLNWQMKVTRSMWDAGLYGAGILKAVWDQALDNGLGNVDLVDVDPWNFYPDPMARNEYDGQYYIEVRRLAFDTIERKFPDRAQRLLDDLTFYSEGDLDSESRPSNTEKSGSQYPMSFSSGYQGGSPSMGLPGQSRIKAPRPEGILVFECWMRETRETEIPDPDFDGEGEAPKITVMAEDWRVVIWSCNTILMDAWASDLWEGATHPYGRFVFEDTGEFWPTPLVTHLAPCQIAINRLLAALQQSAELTGNPIFLEPDQSGISQTLLINRPGQRLKTNTRGGQAPPQWLSPPPMSSDVMGLIRFYIERMENISGLSTTSKGKPPAARTPEAVVSNVQESGFVRVRSGLRNMERTLRRLSEILVQLVIENFTTPRTVSIIGQEGEQSAVTLRARHFIDAVNNEYAPFKYSLIVNAGSDVPTSRQARATEAQNLFVLKAIDRKALLESVRFPHWQAIDQRMQQAEAAAAQAQLENPDSRARTRRSPKP
jgi:hypothetical protein